MLRRQLIASLPGLALAGPALAQATYPDRPITLVVPFLPGGSTDICGRVLAERMAPQLSPNARIIVENRAGAGGSVGSEYVTRAAPDGYTLLVATASSHGSNPAALPDTTHYDPVADFTHIAIIGGSPMVLIVPRTSPYRTPAEVLAAIRARPGQLTWATSGAGGIGHLTGEFMLLSAGNLRAEHVPYRGGSQVMEALAKSEVDFSLEVLATTAPHMRDNLSRALAVTSSRRSPLFPDVPTLAETALPGFDITTWNLLVGPRGMPAELVARLNRAADAALADPVARERLRVAGIDPVDDSTPDSTRDFVVAELAKFRDIVARAQLRLSR